MKHHKEWAFELRHAANVAPNGTLVMVEPWIKQIQLDAMKEGMRRAAKVCDRTNLTCKDAHRKAILTAAEKLTEKDLV